MSLVFLVKICNHSLISRYIYPSMLHNNVDSANYIVEVCKNRDCYVFDICHASHVSFFIFKNGQKQTKRITIKNRT